MNESNIAWSLNEVCFRHAGAMHDTLSGITLEIPGARLTAILGPNGTGKSTLLQLLLGTLHPASGTVEFQHQPVTSYTRKSLAKLIGVVPQGEAEPLFSARDVVAMGRYPHLGPWQRERAEDISAIESAMALCDVARLAHRPVPSLSGGERQRVRVARALAQHAKVLVLDEPTTFLDIRHEMTVFELLRSLRNNGVTVVLATHNLNLAARFADEIVLLHDGKLVANGAPAEVITSVQVSRVYEWPVDIAWHSTGAPQVVPQ